MSRNYVVDANVIGKLILNEYDSVVAESFVIQVIQESSYLFVPALFSYELVGLLKQNNIPDQDIKEFMARYHDTPYMRIVNLDGRLLAKSLEISQIGNKKSGFPAFYDCVYHALAIQKDCDFITADRRHYEKTKGLGNIKLLAAFQLSRCL